MRWIAMAVALAACACTTDQPETFTLNITEQRADTVLKINGAGVDGGGAAPRTLVISYDFANVAEAKNASYLLETFAGGGKLAELTVTPRGCAGVETEAVLIGADGSIGSTADDCAPAAP